MDAVRHGNQMFVSFDLPGVDPDGIDVSVERDVLTVSATRRVLLGEGVDTDRMEAAYDHGVLTLTLPVAEQAKPRKIAVGGGHARQAIETEAHTG